MTKTKKEQILEVALHLFWEYGYNSTSTSKIAKKSQVSEWLIFSHFKNKAGLVKAILDDAEIKAGSIFWPVFEAKEAKDILQKAITQIFTISESERNYWKVIMKLKWEIGYSHPEKLVPYIEKLAWAFRELGYKKPELEARILWKIQEGIISEIIKGNKTQELPMKDFLLTKYTLN